MSAKPVISLASEGFPLGLQEYAPYNPTAYCPLRSIDEDGESHVEWVVARTPSPYRARGESHSWGDFVLDEEEAAEGRMSPEQRAEKELMKIEVEKAGEKELINYYVKKHTQLYTKQVAGGNMSKKKFNTPCKYLTEDGGCWMHIEKPGACSFLHTKEEEAYYGPLFAVAGIQRTHVPSRNAMWVVGVGENGMAILSTTNPEMVKKVVTKARRF